MDTTPRELTEAHSGMGKVGAGAAVAFAGLDTYYLARALADGDSRGAMNATGSLLPNAAMLVDNVVKPGGGFVSQTLGAAVIPYQIGMITSQSIETYYTSSTNKLEHVGEVAIPGAIGVGGGGTLVVLGLTGVMSGGTSVVAGLGVAGVSTLTGAGLKYLEERNYGSMDGMFDEDLRNKSNMHQMAKAFVKKENEGKLDALDSNLVKKLKRDPKTGEVNLSDMDTLNALSELVQHEQDRQHKVEDANGALIAGTQGEQAVKRKVDAMHEIKRTESAQAEIQERIFEIQAQKQINAARKKTDDPELLKIRARISRGYTDEEQGREPGKIYDLKQLLEMQEARRARGEETQAERDRRYLETHVFSSFSGSVAENLAEQYRMVVSHQGAQEAQMAAVISSQDKQTKDKLARVLEHADKGYKKENGEIDQKQKEDDIKVMAELLGNVRSTKEAAPADLELARAWVDNMASDAGRQARTQAIKDQGLLDAALKDSFAQQPADQELARIRQRMMDPNGYKITGIKMPDGTTVPLAASLDANVGRQKDREYLRQRFGGNDALAERYVKAVETLRTQSRINAVTNDPAKVKELTQIMDNVARGYVSDIAKDRDMQKLTALLGGTDVDRDIAKSWIGAVSSEAERVRRERGPAPEPEARPLMVVLDAPAKPAPVAAPPVASPMDPERQKASDALKEKVKAYAAALEALGLIRESGANTYVERVMRKTANLSTQQLVDAIAYMEEKRIRTGKLFDNARDAQQSFNHVQVTTLFQPDAAKTGEAIGSWDKAMQALQKEIQMLNLSGVSGVTELNMKDLVTPQTQGGKGKPAAPHK